MIMMKALIETAVPMPELIAEMVIRRPPASPASAAPMPKPSAEIRATSTPMR